MEKKLKGPVPPADYTGYHPKDSPYGTLIRMSSPMSCGPDLVRGTVIVNLGGASVEFTPQAARKFVSRVMECVDEVLAKASDSK